MAHVQREMRATEEELQAAKVPIGWRDYCADLLIPLNKCREQNYYLPWTCHKEKHAYEKCEYLDYKARVQAVLKEKQEQ